MDWLLCQCPQHVDSMPPVLLTTARSLHPQISEMLCRCCFLDMEIPKLRQTKRKQIATRVTASLVQSPLLLCLSTISRTGHPPKLSVAFTPLHFVLPSSHSSKHRAARPQLHRSGGKAAVPSSGRGTSTGLQAPCTEMLLSHARDGRFHRGQARWHLEKALKEDTDKPAVTVPVRHLGGRSQAEDSDLQTEQGEMRKYGVQQE